MSQTTSGKLASDSTATTGRNSNLSITTERPAGSTPAPTDGAVKIRAENVDFFYSAFHALKKIDIAIPERQITALIGPSGCGKSTFLRSLNRMNDLIDGTRLTGSVTLDGQDIY